MDPISSRHNQRIKDAVKLRGRRQRTAQQRIIIDGAREICHALDSGVRLLEVFVCQPLCRADACSESLARLDAAGVPQVLVAPAVFEKIAFGERAEGLVAVAETPRRELGSLKCPESALLVVLAGVEKPGNVGAVFRSADAAGASAVLLADPGTDLFNPNTIRASLGTVFSVASATDSSENIRLWLQKNRLQVVAAQPSATQDYTGLDYRRPTALVLGSEAAGLGDLWRERRPTGLDILQVRIPMHGVADSLNVSATAAVLLYEAVRQRQPTR